MSQAAPVLKKACDHCRHRKIRCDRTFPCSGCYTSGVNCIPFKGVEKQKQSRVLISTQYERKIDLIEQKLDRLGNLVGSFLSQQPPFSNLEPPTPECFSIHSETPSIRPVVKSPPKRPSIESSYKVNRADIPKGQTSLSAHSSFAVDFLHNAVGTETRSGSGPEFRALIDTLSPIVDAFSSQALRTSPLFPYARRKADIEAQETMMPPIQAAVAVLRLSENSDNIDIQWTSQFFKQFLPSQSLSDLCLKTYFSQDSSNVDFIIINTALYLLASCIQSEQNFQWDSVNIDRDTFLCTCQANLETGLSGLSLYTQPSYEMTLALMLGVVYATEISSSLAHVLTRVASQTAQNLGYHKRYIGTNASGHLNNQGLLFWIIFFLEKMLSLRNGRLSTIVDAEITLPLPEADASSDSHFMNASRNSVRVAGLAGRIYTELYCAESYSLPASVRSQRVSSLSQELQEVSKEARVVIESWIRSATCSNIQRTIKSMLMSDEVLRLSMLTLIHRAMPMQGCSPSTFTDQCVLSARAALESHQEFIREFGLADSIFLTSHITWSILFVPFVPFIVLFCHSIETGDMEDLNSMQAFVTSIQSACAHSPAIAKHHRLFEVFGNVAVRYCELKARTASLNPAQMELRMELDAQLSVLGFQPPPIPSLQEGDEGFNVLPKDSDSATANDVLEDGFNIGDWLSFSQNMMALVDTGDIQI